MYKWGNLSLCPWLSAKAGTSLHELCDKEPMAGNSWNGTRKKRPRTTESFKVEGWRKICYGLAG